MNLLKKSLNAILKTNLVNLKVFDLEETNPFYNKVVIATSTSRQTAAVIGYLKQELKNVFEIKGIEGQRSGWTLIDLGEIVIHLFTEEMREYYKFDERFIGIKEISVK